MSLYRQVTIPILISWIQKKLLACSAFDKKNMARMCIQSGAIVDSSYVGF